MTSCQGSIDIMRRLDCYIMSSPCPYIVSVMHLPVGTCQLAKASSHMSCESCPCQMLLLHHMQLANHINSLSAPAQYMKEGSQSCLDRAQVRHAVKVPGHPGI